MNIDPEERYYLKLKAAHYYYNEGYTQQEIAKMLNISRPTLLKLFKEARAEGIVEIKIHDIKNNGSLLDLEVQLKKRYKLEDVRVVDCVKDDDMEVAKEIGKAAAVYFERILKDGMKIGVAWGKTLEAMVENLKENKSIRDLQIVTLIGGAVGVNPQVHSNILSQKILDKYHGKGYFLYAPIIVDNKQLLEALMANTETSKILELAKNVSVALVGIGGPIEVSTVLESGYFNKEQIKELEDCGVVGDICSRFFDENGNICKLDLNERIVGITLDDLKKIKKVIAVAGGKNKVKSIQGALNGHYIDVLITDRYAAEYLLGKA